VRSDRTRIDDSAPLVFLATACFAFRCDNQGYSRHYSQGLLKYRYPVVTLSHEYMYAVASTLRGRHQRSEINRQCDKQPELFHSFVKLVSSKRIFRVHF